MLKSIELHGFKSFGRKCELTFTSPIAAIVGPNGSGKSNVAEGFRFVLGEQSMKSLRSKKGEDLIWGGSPGLPRSNRASVKITFDNRAHLLPLDFEEVVIERVVFRDGVNDYSINGTKVRLRDVSEMLSAANVGTSQYHIISQGEADRVLSASPRERREMVEEALGLRFFQHKKAESEKKLEETALNLQQVASLRRELAPHITYLRKQVEKIEKARELQDELSGKLSEYLARENAYLTEEKTRVSNAHKEISDRLLVLQRSLAEARGTVASRSHEVGDEDEKRVRDAEEGLSEARREREEASRALGRAEGELSALRSVVSTHSQNETESVARSRVSHFIERIEQLLSEARTTEDSAIRSTVLTHIDAEIKTFRIEIGESEEAGSDSGPIKAALTRVESLATSFKEAETKESAAEHRVVELRAELAEAREAYHSAERDLLSQTGEERELSARLFGLDEHLQELARLRELFEEEVREGVVLIGSSVSWEGVSIPSDARTEDRGIQEGRRRTIERLKIKIEEYRGGNVDEVLKEYNETQTRDQFLARETEDLEHSALSLRSIIEELDSNIDDRFKSGLALIRTEFNAYFTELFGGGHATLELEKSLPKENGSEEEVVAGLAVSVQLPRKQMRGLEVLSGGERALTSIALIFAMSQVNPPPFLILDETDAALDEANSRRYASIVESLAKRSQLILITHNRATMAAAGELYGVTMGQDGVSKLLSVKLEEAEQVAK